MKAVRIQAHIWLKENLENDMSVDLAKSFLSFLKRSAGVPLFQSFFVVNKNGKSQDVLQKGILSCAFFVSSILVVFRLISRVHMTVKSTEKDLKRHGWKRVKVPRPGAVLVWESKMFDDGPHAHIGFYLGNKKAVSHSTKERVPVIHHWTFGSKGKKPVRQITAIYLHPSVYISTKRHSRNSGSSFSLK